MTKYNNFFLYSFFTGVLLYSIHLILTYIYCELKFEFTDYEQSVCDLQNYLELIHILLYFIGVIGFFLILFLKKADKNGFFISFYRYYIMIVILTEMPIYYCFIHEGFSSFWHGIHLK